VLGTEVVLVPLREELLMEGVRPVDIGAWGRAVCPGLTARPAWDGGVEEHYGASGARPW